MEGVKDGIGCQLLRGDWYDTAMSKDGLRPMVVVVVLDDGLDDRRAEGGRPLTGWVDIGDKLGG
jgi:hypothetical protein